MQFIIFTNFISCHYEINWEPYMLRIFNHIHRSITSQLQDNEFVLNLDNLNDIIAPEENLCKNSIVYCARLAVYLLRPAKTANSKCTKNKL